MAGALDGIRVIDFGQYIAGPLTAMLLADQGADVVRVDPPGGPRWDTPANATWNRGKRSIVLDLKEAADRERARRLVATADVLIENFRPGVMDRLGLGPEETTASNPRLVYCSLPGFASDDPRAGTRAWEGVVGAATATYRQDPRTGRPIYTAIPISSVYAAFQAAVGIAAALNVRERDGVGQVVEAPLFDSTFGAIGVRASAGGLGGDGAALARRMGISGQYQCKDGRWVMYMGGNLRARDFLDAVGATDWVDALAAGRMTPEELRERAEALFRTRTAMEWELFSEEIGTECAVCRTSAEWLEDPGALGSKIIVDIDDPLLGRVRGPGVNARLATTPSLTPRARRETGADREEVLSELAGRSSPMAPAVEGVLRDAFAGVRVLDLCIILAGPTCGRTMGEFGADVIKIDSPSREAVVFHNDINRAKRSIILDLKSEEGMKVFWRLVDTADVVVQNFRKGVAERLGFGYEAVRARKPGIVYASLNTYGQVGPFAGRPGHEQIAQAATGMQERFGGSGRPTLQPFPVNDYGTGYMGAFAVALALFQRRRTGEGQHVDTALAYTATVLQSSLIQSYEGKRWDEPRGQETVGSGPLHRAYEARDGWLFLGARREDLSRSSDLAPLAGLAGEELERRLEEALRERGVAEWVERLTAAGIGAHAIVRDPAELAHDPWVVAHGLTVTREHEGIGPLTTTGACVRLSRTPPSAGRPAAKPGSDAASILAEVGLLGEMDRLVREGVVVLEGVTAR
jgi:crotonobetainyl-CoA:carnitine CoA-transferase CaiB-like acyl-CoA transferase